jgi:hypothetical protein
MDPKKIKIGAAISGLIGLLIGLSDQPSQAGETDPTLLIARAVASDTRSGTLIRIDATFPWNALIQSGYPLKLVVWRRAGTPDFVELDLVGSARSGSNPAVIDGLETAEVGPFSTSGQSNPAHALTLVDDGRIEAVLGAEFVGAPLGAQLYVIDHGTPFVSNPIDVGRGLP